MLTEQTSLVRLTGALDSVQSRPWMNPRHGSAPASGPVFIFADRSASQHLQRALEPGADARKGCVGKLSLDMMFYMLA